MTNKQEEYMEAVKNGWLPSHKDDGVCSCHINPPCEHCVFDDAEDYYDEWLEEQQ